MSEQELAKIEQALDYFERRVFALVALHGILSQVDTEPEDATHNAIVALRNADALLAALQKGQK